MATKETTKNLDADAAAEAVERAIFDANFTRIVVTPQTDGKHTVEVTLKDG